MKKHILSVLLISLLSAAALSGCSDNTDAPKESTTAASQEGTSGSSGGLQAFEPPVSFQAKTIDGDELTSDILADSKLTMINVWATYCNPCLNEMPALGEIAASYSSEDFQIIGIISDVPDTSDEETLTLAKDLIDETQANYTHLLLNEELYYGMLEEVTAVPTTFFVNADRQIVDTIVGAMEKEDWEVKIEELLTTL